MPETPSSGQAGERLAKVVARAGMCSRRDAEDWIRAGRVAVNGSIIRTPAYNVTPRDSVAVDGQPLAERKGTRLWLYHKPPGLVVTEKDPEGRETVFERLAAEGLPRVLTVGRLDINTEGLLLLTNDGGLKRVLELPATGWLRRYRVRAFGAVTQAQLDALKDGIEVDGITYGPIEAALERQQGSNVWLIVALREGKNREVKNVLATLGLQVNRLIRVSYGPFQLGDLPMGGVEVVRSRVLREQLGRKLAEQAGVDFDSELPEPAALARARGSEPQGRGPERGDRGRPPAGRPGSPGRRPASGRFEEAPPERGRRDREEGPERRLLFVDGRPPEGYRPLVKRDKGADGERPRRGPPRPGADRGVPSRSGAESRSGGPGARPPRDDLRRDGPPRGRAPSRTGGRTERSDQPRKARSGPPSPRPPRGDGAPQRHTEGPKRAPRARPENAAAQGASRSGGPRPARGAPRSPGMGPPRGARPAGPTGDRPSRSAGTRPAGPRPPRPGGRPSGPGGKPTRAPAGARPGGARPAGPGGRPSGARPARPGGGRPGGARPSGPGGSRPPRKPRGG